MIRIYQHGSKTDDNDLKNVHDVIEKFKNKETLTYTTSGTTGYPKTVPNKYETFRHAAEKMVEGFELDSNSVIFAILPKTSVGCPAVEILPAYLSGCEYHFSVFNPNEYIDQLMDIQPSCTIVLPSIWKSLSRTDAWKKVRFNGYVSAGADIVPPEMFDDIRAKGGIPRQIYGSTEVPPSLWISEDATYSGKLNEGAEYYLSDEGELHIRWKTQETFWQSGDLFEETDKGLRMIGRKHNVFMYREKKYYPEGIEAQAVKQGATSALCRLERKPMLYVTGVDNVDVDPAIVVRRVDELQKTPLGKILRKQEL